MSVGYCFLHWPRRSACPLCRAVVRSNPLHRDQIRGRDNPLLRHTKPLRSARRAHESVARTPNSSHFQLLLEITLGAPLPLSRQILFPWHLLGFSGRPCPQSLSPRHYWGTEQSVP